VGVLRHPCMCWKVEDYYACLVQAGHGMGVSTQGTSGLSPTGGPMARLVQHTARTIEGTVCLGRASRL
jgi:hypothetical protein